MSAYRWYLMLRYQIRSSRKHYKEEKTVKPWGLRWDRAEEINKGVWEKEHQDRVAIGVLETTSMFRCSLGGLLESAYSCAYS